MEGGSRAWRNSSACCVLLVFLLFSLEDAQSEREFILLDCRSLFVCIHERCERHTGRLTEERGNEEDLSLSLSPVFIVLDQLKS